MYKGRGWSFTCLKVQYIPAGLKIRKMLVDILNVRKAACLGRIRATWRRDRGQGSLQR